MKKLAWLVMIVLLVSVAAAQEELCSVNIPCDSELDITAIDTGVFGEAKDEGPYCIYYFYGQLCPHCANIKPMLEELEKKYTNFQFKAFEVQFNSTNKEMFDDFMSRYNVQKQGVPAIFISDISLVGENAIRDNIETLLEKYSIETPLCPVEVKRTSIEGSVQDINPAEKVDLTVGALITAALIDSINPCAFSVLIVLLVTLTALGGKKRILKVGLTFITVVFITYFASGLGILRFMQYMEMTRFVYQAAAWLAIAAGVINVKDFFWYGKGISLHINEKHHAVMKRYMDKASIPAAIVLGFLVSMFELPCTGGVYLAVLSLLADNATRMSAVPYLLLYNMIFVMPLVLILLIVYREIPPESVEHWRMDKRKWLRLAMGAFMILLGWAMLSGWF